MPYGIYLYELSTPATAVRKYYDDWARSQEWQIVEHKGNRAYVRDDGFQAILSAAERSGRTRVSLVEAGSAKPGSNIASFRVELTD